MSGDEVVSHPPTPLRNIVLVNPGSTGTPVFLVHGMSGEVLLYRHLINRMGRDRPIYAVQASGLDEVTRPLLRIEDMATHYIREILRVAPNQPYAFVGVCAGVSVVFEMAHQLSGMGMPVESLILLDALPRPVEPVALRAWLKVHAVVRRRLPEIIRHSRHQIGWLVERYTKAVVYRPSGASNSRSATYRRQVVTSSNQRATSRYRAPVYAGKIILMTGVQRAGRLSPFGRAQWAKRVGANLETYEVEGAVHRTLLEEPFVQEVAKVIEQSLAK